MKDACLLELMPSCDDRGCACVCVCSGFVCLLRVGVCVRRGDVYACVCVCVCVNVCVYISMY